MVNFELRLPFTYVNPMTFTDRLRQTSMLRKIGLCYNHDYDISDFKVSEFFRYCGDLFNAETKKTTFYMRAEEFFKKYDARFIRFEERQIIIGAYNKWSTKCETDDYVSYIMKILT